MTTNNESPPGTIPSHLTELSPTITSAPGINGTSSFEIPLRIQITLDVSGGSPHVTTTAESAITDWESSAESEATAESAHAAKQAAAPEITYDQFMAMVDDPDVSAQDLAPYFLRDESLDRGLEPGFRIHPGKVMMDPMLESALGLNFANWAEKMKRQQRYVKQIRQNPNRIRIVSEGDSWFQYPVMLYDIIDHLMDRPELGIFCCSEAGDVISNMLPKGEFYVPLQRENAAIFLFSGGGNDLVDGAGLRRFLRNLPPGSAPQDHFIPAYKDFMKNMAAQYETLFTRVLRHKPGIHIICHGYSDAIPQPGKGKWLGKPMTQIGITDARTQQSIVKIIIKDLNELLERTAAKFGRNSTYVDLRGIVPPNGWHDEFHPTSDYFGKAAAPIYREILRHA